jgi:hypothetical protein
MPMEHVASDFRKCLLPATHLFLSWLILRLVEATSSSARSVDFQPDEVNKKKLYGLSPRANYTDRATAACDEVNGFFKFN